MGESYAYTPQIWPSLVTIGLLVALAAFSWRRRAVPGALPFAAACLFALMWVAGAAAELMAVDPAAKLAWFKFQAVWQLPAITATTCFILEYVNPGRWLTRRTLILLCIPPLLVVVQVLTSGFHHWQWLSFSVGTSVVPQRGLGFWIMFAYSVCLMLVNLIALGWLFVRSPWHRWPVALMLVGHIAARSVHALEIAGGAAISGWDPFLFSIAFAFGMYAIALFGFRIFDPVAAARQVVIAQMREGVLVLDAEGSVAALNPAGERILRLPARQAMGWPVGELLPATPSGPLADPGGVEMEISLPEGDGDDGQAAHEARQYVLEISPLKDWRGSEVGRLLVLRDVTERRQAQAQILEQQRALAMFQEREQLARELHDSLGQVFAFVNTQGQTVRRLLSRGHITAADELVGRLVEVAREADVDIRESILGLRESLSERGLFPALAHYLKQYEKNSGVHTELQVPETLTGRAFEPQVEVQLLRIVQEALTNVRKHARARCVRVVFVAEPGWARVTVQDDGQGFDPGTRDDGTGSHVGLRVMRERAEEVGGSLSLTSEPGQGTQVVVRVPLRQVQEVDP